MKLVPRTALAAALLLALPGVAWAQARGEILAFGQTQAEETGSSAAPILDSRAMPVTAVAGVHFVRQTDALQARLCLRFGVLIRLIAEPGAALPAAVEVTMRHPPTISPDHGTSTEESFTAPLAGDLVYPGMDFDDVWEMQPGTWQITFSDRGTVLGTKTFAIAAPPPGASVCPGQPVS